MEWLKPYTDDAIKDLGERGTESLLAVPISFVSEHIETLEEIDMEYRELALSSGIKNWGRVPALNTNKTFIDDLAELVIEKLPSAQPRPGYVAEAFNLGPPTGTITGATGSCRTQGSTLIKLFQGSLFQGSSTPEGQDLVAEWPDLKHAPAGFAWSQARKRLLNCHTSPQINQGSKTRLDCYKQESPNLNES